MNPFRGWPTSLLRIFVRILLASGLMPGLLHKAEMELFARDVASIAVDLGVEAWLCVPAAGIN